MPTPVDNPDYWEMYEDLYFEMQSYFYGNPVQATESPDMTTAA